MKRVKGPPEIVDGIYYPLGKAYGDPPRPKYVAALGAVMLSIILVVPFILDALGGPIPAENRERSLLVSWIGAAGLASFLSYVVFRYQRGKRRLERKLKDGI